MVAKWFYSLWFHSKERARQDASLFIRTQVLMRNCLTTASLEDKEASEKGLCKSSWESSQVLIVQEHSSVFCQCSDWLQFHLDLCRNVPWPIPLQVPVVALLGH